MNVDEVISSNPFMHTSCYHMGTFSISFLGQIGIFVLLCRAFWGSNERGDQMLSNDGGRDPVRCLERWQIAIKNLRFTRKKTLTFEKCLCMEELSVYVRYVCTHNWRVGRF